VDETKTGLGSAGKYWAHEHWYLSEERTPDFVTFGGKSGLAGFYANKGHSLNSEATSFACNMDEAKLLQVVKYGQIYKIAQKAKLLHWALDTSSFLKLELGQIEKDKHLIHNIRGYGTHIGFDLKNEKTCDSVQRWLWRCGFNLHKVGPKTLGLRPSMTLSIEEAGKFRTALKHYSPNFEKQHW
jgi:4-aminobutyrate aminotransferase/(S)-3-amino-2-methylpropionate transaminase